jgi:DNA polymerase
MMTREDMLRELELLPVWQLRTPLPKVEVVSETVTVYPPLEFMEEPEPEAQDAIVELPVPAQVLLTYIASDNGHWLFVLAHPPQADDEVQLLNNIFKAMQVQVKPADTQAYSITLIANHQPKIVLTLGEVATQTVMQSTERLLDLRGQLHDVAGVKLVPTFDLKHLINNPLDKALAWCDCCLAMQYLNAQV